MFTLRSAKPVGPRCRLLAAVAAGLLLAFPTGALGAAKGLQTEMTWGVSSSDQQTDVNDLTDLGAQWTRLTISWHDAEPSKGSYSSSYMNAADHAVSLAHNARIHVL